MPLLLDDIEAVARRDRKDRQVRRYEARVRRAMRKMFREQRDALLRGSSGLRPYFRESEVEDELVRAWNRAKESGVLQAISVVQEVDPRVRALGFTSAADDIGVALTFDIQNPAVLEWAQTRSTNLVAGLNDTTLDRLRTVIRDGVENGDSWSTVSRNISERFGEFSGERADLIAITEIGEAYEEGRREAGRSLQARGVDMEKRWLTARDDLVCPICAGNGDAGWIRFDAEFPSGTQSPLGHPGCRCDEQLRAA